MPGAALPWIELLYQCDTTVSSDGTTCRGSAAFDGGRFTAAMAACAVGVQRSANAGCQSRRRGPSMVPTGSISTAPRSRRCSRCRCSRLTDGLWRSPCEPVGMSCSPSGLPGDDVGLPNGSTRRVGRKRAAAPDGVDVHVTSAPIGCPRRCTHVRLRAGMSTVFAAPRSPHAVPSPRRAGRPCPLPPRTCRQPPWRPPCRQTVCRCAACDGVAGGRQLVDPNRPAAPFIERDRQLTCRRNHWRSGSRPRFRRLYRPPAAQDRL